MRNIQFVNDDDAVALKVTVDDNDIITEYDGNYQYIIKGAEVKFADGVPLQFVLGKMQYFGVDEVDDDGNVVKRDKPAADPEERVTSKVAKMESTIAEVGEIAKLDEDKQMVFGWAYISHDKDGIMKYDKSGEYIEDYGELEDAAYAFVIKSRAAGDSHKRHDDKDEHINVGTMVESMMFTPEKVEKMGLPKGTIPTGWWVGFKVDDADVWKAVKNGERPAFSIHGKGMREET